MEKVKENKLSERFHLYTNASEYLDKINKSLAKAQDDIRVYNEQVDFLMKEIDIMNDSPYRSKRDKMILYFRYYWLVKHGIFIETEYNLGAIKCYDNYISHDNPYIFLRTRNGDNILFIDLDDIETLPEYAKTDMWKLSVHTGKTENSKEEFFKKDFLTFANHQNNKQNSFMKLSFLQDWSFLVDRSSSNTRNDFSIERFEFSDKKFLMIYPKSIVR